MYIYIGGFFVHSAGQVDSESQPVFTLYLLTLETVLKSPAAVNRVVHSGRDRRHGGTLGNWSVL